MIKLLIIVGVAVCHSLKTNEGITVDVKESAGVIVTLFTQSTAAEQLNLHWWVPEAKSVEEFKMMPEISVHGVAEGGALERVAQMDRSTVALLDEPYWPVVVKGYKEYRVNLKSPMQYSLMLSSQDNVKLLLNQSVILTVPRSSVGASLLLDLKDNNLEKGDKIAIELYMCKGVFKDVEIFYKSLEGKFMKYRRNDMQGKVMEKPYLVPIEVKNTSQAYQFDLFKPEGNNEEVIFRAKLVRLHNSSYPNLISIHQALDNIDYPIDSKIEQSIERSQVTFKMPPNPYLLGLHDLKSPLISSLIIESPKRDSLKFRLMCSVDPSLIGSLQAKRTDPETSSRPVSTSENYVDRLTSTHKAAKRVFYWQERTYTAWSEIVSAKSFSDSVFGQTSSSSSTASDGIFSEEMIIGLLLILIVLVAGLLVWALRAQKNVQEKIALRKLSKKIAPSEETKKLTGEIELSVNDEMDCKERQKQV